MPEKTSQKDLSLGIGAEKAAQLSNVSLLYYGEGMTQSDIAKRMKVSRATVVNMLRESRALGIVDIRVDGRHLKGSDLARRLCDKYQIADVYIAQSAADGQTVARADALVQVARVAAMAILDLVAPGDRVGVAWGETIMAVANALPRNPVPKVQVCQLIGSMISDRVPASEQCTIQIAERLDAAACYTLHAPGLVSSASLAGTLRAEPAIKAQLARLGQLDMTIASIGHVNTDTHLAAAGMASEADLEAAQAAGAVGILCCRYLNANGDPLELPPQERLIAASLADLRAAKKRLLVVCGTDRRAATQAALKAGCVTHLCVDRDLAKALLDD